MVGLVMALISISWWWSRNGGLATGAVLRTECLQVVRRLRRWQRLQPGRSEQAVQPFEILVLSKDRVHGEAIPLERVERAQVGNFQPDYWRPPVALIDGHQ